MGRKVSTHIARAVLTAGIVLGVLGVALRPFDGAQDRLRSGQAQAATGNIDPVNKWAWGTNVGWINFRPEHGGVTVCSDHLEGYAWGENSAGSDWAPIPEVARTRTATPQPLTMA